MVARRSSRAAFTMVELLLVLAVLVALVAITWPSFQRLYGDHTLLDGAEQARLQMAATRTRAIESGIAYQFRWEPSGRWFLSLPFEPELDAPAEGAAGDNLTTLTARNFAGELPETLSFISEQQGPVGESLPPELFSRFVEAEKLAAIGWSPAVIFLPDGSAVDGDLVIGDQQGRRISLTLRGVTGSVRVSPLRTEAAGNGT